MPLFRFTVSQKIAAGYLLVVVFCLAAVMYALTTLGKVTNHSEQLVSTEFKTFTLAGELSRSILDQERLEKQILVLQDVSMLPLLDNRQQEIDGIWAHFSTLLQEKETTPLKKSFRAYKASREDSRNLLLKEQWQEAEQQSAQVLSPRRDHLLRGLIRFRQDRERLMNETIRVLALDLQDGYRLTLTLSFVGIGLAALVAAGVILKIHRAIGQLGQATRAIAAGNYNYPLSLEAHDEFGHLARNFAEMTIKLRDLEELHLDANPLTRLPGNLSITSELERRISEGEPFAHIYVDLDYFKAYNDRYGYQAGSGVIARVGEMVREIGAQYGTPQDLIGHIGGDDYVLLSSPERAEEIASELIKAFDAMVPELYNEKDRRLGYFRGQDRYGEERQFPLLSMSIAIVCSNNLANPSAEAIGRECAKMKEHLKTLPGSNYLIDRRELR